MSRLDLVVGPNGAGKSTFVREVLSKQLPNSLFVNADMIAARNWPDEPELHSYEAAKLAERTRTALVERGQQFIAETVFSHPSKLELIEAALAKGYFVALQVLMVPEAEAVARVAYRAANGGHWVPEEKIRERYARLWPLIAQAADRVQSASFWDNSGVRIVAVAELIDGQLVGSTKWPIWAPTILTERWA
jgi:predicted ABC-type ATPase